MASTRAILQAAKAIPGGRPTPVPQGNAPYLGATSPVVQAMDAMNGYASAYGPYLPRPPGEFTQGAFGPFSPVLPVPVDTPTASGRAEPRREQYQVGWDLPVGEPGSEGIKLATFASLRTLADLYSVARACIQKRKSEVRGLEWDIMPTTDAAKAHKGDRAWYQDFGERRAKAMRFFRRPDPDYFSWNTFIDAFLEEIFVFDALSLYLRPKRGRGRGWQKGLLGSDLDCLNLVSGPTIRPLYAIDGSFPRPPAPAYQQYLYGVPRSDFMQLVTGRDIEESGLAGSAWGQFRGDQLLYLPMVPRRWTPYGFPPIERALIPVMSGLQKQGWQLDWFREGTVPAVYMSPGDETMTPNQIRELQDTLNAFAGDPAMHHKIIVLPPGTKVMPQRDAQLADQFDEVIMNQVCMAFDVMPMELGISPKVSTTQSPGAANQMAKMSQSATERTSTKPLLAYISDIMDAILQDVCGQDDMKFVFEGTQEEEDQKQLTDLLVEQINSGLLSIDEGRDELNRQPWGLPETSGPVTITPTGPVPFGSMPLAPGNPVTGPQLPPGQGPAADDQGGGPPEGGAAGADGAEPSGGEAGTPGHAAAAAGDAESGKAGSRGGSGAGGTPSQGAAQVGPAQKPAAAAKVADPAAADRAVRAELEALTRHLTKGRAVSTWEPRHVPQQTLAAVSRHLAAGLGPAAAVELARASTAADIRAKAAAPTPAPPPAAAPPPPTGTSPAAPPQPTWPAWAFDAALVAVFGPQLLAAFESASGDLAHLLYDLERGAAALTWAAAKGQMGITLAQHLAGPLAALWRAAWRLGDGSAAALLRGDDALAPPTPAGAVEPDAAGAADAWIRRNLDEALGGLSQTNLDRLRPVAGTPTPDAAEVARLLEADRRSRVIAHTEVPRALSAGAVNRYDIAGVTRLEWLTEPDPCPRCLLNRDAGPVAVGDVFPTGDPAPPAHPNCRCGLAPVAFAGDLGAPAGVTGALKRQRRHVALDGEVSWDEAGYPPSAAGGGGQSPVRHWGDGTQAANDTPVTGGVSGSTAGGEPPRWDTPGANGYQGGLHDLSGPHPRDGGTWPSGASQGEAPPGAAMDPDLTRGGWGVQGKAAGAVLAAGVLVHAADTGRVLLLQRAATESHPSAGLWELPGGRLEPGEDARAAAVREWQEETGLALPAGAWGGAWTSPDGAYRGYVYRVSREADVPVEGPRDQVANPDAVVKVGPKGYTHGWVKVGVGVDSSHLSLRKNGDIVHRETGAVLGHATRTADFPRKGTTTFKVTHANGDTVYGGVYKREALAAVAQHHNKLQAGAHAPAPTPMTKPPQPPPAVKPNPAGVADPAAVKKAIKPPATVTAADRAALAFYTGHGFRQINDGLRGTAAMSPEAADHAAQLRALVRRSEVTAPIQVSRRVRNGDAVFGPVGSHVGQTFADKAFSSTSTQDMPWFGDVTVTYHLAPGTKALDVGHIDGSDQREDTDEGEVLLGPNQRFTVLSDQVSGGQRHVVVANAAGAAAAKPQVTPAPAPPKPVEPEPAPKKLVPPKLAVPKPPPAPAASPKPKTSISNSDLEKHLRGVVGQHAATYPKAGAPQVRVGPIKLDPKAVYDGASGKVEAIYDKNTKTIEMIPSVAKRDTTARSSKRGFYVPSGAASYRDATIAHEFGHHLDFELGHQNPQARSQLHRAVANLLGVEVDNLGFPQFMKPKGRAIVTSKVSTLAAFSPRELIAELFTEGTHAPNPQPAAKLVTETFQKELG